MSAFNSLTEHLEVGGALGGDAIGASNGASFDTRGIEEVMIVVAVGDIASSGTLTIQVQDSATGAVWANVPGASFVVDINGTNETFVGRILTNNTNIDRYLRVVGTVANEALSYGAVIVAGEQHDKPVTQENSVQFEIFAETAN